MRALVRLAGAGCAFLLGLAAAPRAARADASSWLAVSGGSMLWKQGAAGLEPVPVMSFDLGVGTTPEAAVILGGLFRLTPLFGEGSDLALTLRGATRGFQAGTFGVALDAGAYQRFWGAGSQGFVGGATLGLPLAIQIGVQAHVGTDDAFGVAALAGVDLVRLTIYRQSLLEWWPNPRPAPRTASR